MATDEGENDYPPAINSSVTYSDLEHEANMAALYEYQKPGTIECSIKNGTTGTSQSLPQPNSETRILYNAIVDEERYVAVRMFSRFLMQRKLKATTKRQVHVAS